MTTFLICWFILAAGHFAAYTRTLDNLAGAIPSTSALELAANALWTLLFWWIIPIYCLWDGYRRFFR